MPKPQPSPQPVARSHAAALSAATRGAASCPVEDIAQAYLTSTQGDAGIALRCAITDALSDLMDSEEAREGMLAFLQKRPPRWAPTL